jgi:hypothetical protein
MVRRGPTSHFDLHENASPAWPWRDAQQFAARLAENDVLAGRGTDS